MKKSIRRRFGDQRPRAYVLDDHAGARVMTSRQLRQRGFEVVQCRSVDEFWNSWEPGAADIIVADWQLSANERGDKILEEVRQRDWEVPFVLVSGKLEEDSDRVRVLANLLERGQAKFVKRGGAGIKQACDEAEELLERRDVALLKVILAFRPGALAGSQVVTSSGKRSVAALLQEILANPSASLDAEEPVARKRSESIIARRKK